MDAPKSLTKEIERMLTAIVHEYIGSDIRVHYFFPSKTYTKETCLVVFDVRDTLIKSIKGINKIKKLRVQIKRLTDEIAHAIWDVFKGNYEILVGISYSKKIGRISSEIEEMYISKEGII